MGKVFAQGRGTQRLRGLLAAGGAALVAGAAVGAGHDGAATPSAHRTRAPAATAPWRVTGADRAAVGRLPLGQVAGLAVMDRFSGPRMSAAVLSALRHGRAVGTILFRDNLTGPAAARALTRRLDRAAAGHALVLTDQEGGTVRRLTWAPPARPQSAVRTVASARAVGRAAARGLADAGIDVNLAPVADRRGPGTLMRSRAFPGRTAAVARLTAAAVAGYAGTGVAPALKHFPGLGAARANTDDGPVTIARSAATIGRADLPPFAAGLAAGAPIVMLSHARYPALDPGAIASQSRAVVTDLLKTRLGFGGVAITDAVEARAVRDAMGPGAAAVRSVRAGVDLVLTTVPGNGEVARRALVAEARRRTAFRTRLEDAAARVHALRRWLTG